MKISVLQNVIANSYRHGTNDKDQVSDTEGLASSTATLEFMQDSQYFSEPQATEPHIHHVYIQRPKCLHRF